MAEKGIVLLVDDNPANNKLLATYLKADSFRCIAAANGPEGLEMARREQPDIILLDVMMPGMDGFEVTHALKADPRTRDIPVVLVTALDQAEDRVRGLDAGADDFLSKPVNRVEVVARVRALYRLKQAQDELRHRAEMVTRINTQALAIDYCGADVVLLVEDDRLLAKSLTVVLSSKGYQVIAAHDAAEARACLDNCIPDIVLLDLLLPDTGGNLFLNELKADERMGDVPVVVLTSLPDLEPKLSAIESGVDDYLVKPVDSSELVARVRACLRRAKAHEKLKMDVERLYFAAVTDPLTGLRNRKFLETDVGNRIAVAQRYGNHEFSFVILDLDHFKAVNDRFGHDAGDQALKAVGKVLAGAVRESDIVARYGGEEFCVLVPATSLEGACGFAERLRRAVENARLEDYPDLRMAASFGVATYRKEDSGFIDLLRRADRALYQAKSEGRNRVCAAS